jgi:hypothetical protein
MAERRWVDVDDDCYYAILGAAGLFFASDLAYKRFSFSLSEIRKIAMREFDSQCSEERKRAGRKRKAKA